MRTKNLLILSVVLLMPAVSAVTAHAQVSDVRIRPGITTHMGQKASDHVTLELVGGSFPSTTDSCPRNDFQRLLPDGRRAEGVFRVPAGQVLVVTDVDWEYSNTSGALAGTTQIFRLWVENLVESESVVALRSPFILNSTGYGAGSIHLTSGFIVSSAARVCATVAGGGTSIGGALRGYLAPDR